MKLKFSHQLFEKSSNIKFHKIPSSGSRVVSCGQTDMTNLRVAFRNFVNAPKKVSVSLLIYAKRKRARHFKLLLQTNYALNIEMPNIYFLDWTCTFFLAVSKRRFSFFVKYITCTWYCFAPTQRLRHSSLLFTFLETLTGVKIVLRLNINLNKVTPFTTDRWETSLILLQVYLRYTNCRKSRSGRSSERVNVYPQWPSTFRPVTLLSYVSSCLHEVSRFATYASTSICHWNSQHGVSYHVCAHTWYVVTWPLPCDNKEPPHGQFASPHWQRNLRS